jgi:hypothetical protein
MLLMKKWFDNSQGLSSFGGFSFEKRLFSDANRGLGSKLAVLLEILATENCLFSNEKPTFLDSSLGMSDKNITNNSIFQGLSNGVSELIRN